MCLINSPSPLEFLVPCPLNHKEFKNNRLMGFKTFPLSDLFSYTILDLLIHSAFNLTLFFSCFSYVVLLHVSLTNSRNVNKLNQYNLIHWPYFPISKIYVMLQSSPSVNRWVNLDTIP